MNKSKKTIVKDVEISAEEFDKLLAEQQSIMQWRDLEINKVYTVMDFYSENECTVLKLSDGTETYCPEHFANKIDGKSPPFYFRPLGLKPTRNGKNKYHAYDLVFPKST